MTLAAAAVKYIQVTLKIYNKFEFEKRNRIKERRFVKTSCIQNSYLQMNTFIVFIKAFFLKDI